VTQVLCPIINIYILILLARAVMSWFPIRPGTGAASFLHVLMQLTEPVLAPVRRVIPPAGMFDISFLVVVVVIEIIHGIICGGGLI
jgi:YggT family protein